MENTYKNFKECYEEIAIKETNIIKKNQVGKVYGWSSVKWDHYHIGTSQIYYPIFINYLKENNFNTFNTGIEFACGTTTIFDFIQVKEKKVSDLTTTHCNFMKNKGYNVTQGNIEDKLFEENYSDITSACGILNFVINYDKAVHQLKRVTKNNGLILITVPFEQTITKVNINSKGTGLALRDFNLNNLKERFEDYNFEIVFKYVQPQTDCPDRTGTKYISVLLLILKNIK
jgi:hypothetical protein